MRQGRLRIVGAARADFGQGYWELGRVARLDKRSDRVCRDGVACGTARHQDMRRLGRLVTDGLAGTSNQQVSRPKIKVIAGEPDRHEPRGILGIPAQIASRRPYRGRGKRPWLTHTVESCGWGFERSYLRWAPCGHLEDADISGYPGGEFGRRPREWFSRVQHDALSGTRRALASGSVRVSLGTWRPSARVVSRGEWCMVWAGSLMTSSLMAAGSAASVTGTSVFVVSCHTCRHAVDDDQYPSAETVGRAV
jgi:hypothetical protein